MVFIWVIHPVVEFGLTEPFLFGLLYFSPIFVARFVAKIRLSYNWFTGVKVERLAAAISLCQFGYLIAHPLPYIWPTESFLCGFSGVYGEID